MTGEAPDAPTEAVSDDQRAGTVSHRLHSRLQHGWLWVLVHMRPPNQISQVLLYGLYAYVFAFITKWAAAWVLLVLLAPNWLLPGDAAVATIAEVLPALMVSIFVFILGAFFVVNQQATQIHSNRASLLLLYDSQVHHAVARPLIISVATLAMALVIPQDAGPAVAALALVLVVATAFTLVSAATLLPYLVTRVTAPRNFALFANEGADELLEAGAAELVVYRVGLLGEMLKRGVRSGDSLQLREALNGMDRFHQVYIDAAARTPAARLHQYENGGQVVGWLGEEMVSALVSAGQEAIGGDIANEDANKIAVVLARFGINSAQAGHLEEYNRAVDGLGELGTCTQQMKVPGLINAYAEPVYGLASQVAVALEHLGEEAAAKALVTWGLVVGYAAQHLGAVGHTQWDRSLLLWPDDTPFHEANDYVDTDDFQVHWANKLAAIRPVTDDQGKLLFPGGVDALHEYLANAEGQHQALVQQGLTP
jgi:hypothetical protein